MAYSAEESSPVAYFESCCVCDEEFSSDGELTNHLIEHGNDTEFKASLLELEKKQSSTVAGASRNLPTKPVNQVNKQQTLKRSFPQRSTSPEVWEIISDDSGDESTKSKAPKLNNSFRLVTNATDNSQSNIPPQRLNNTLQQTNNIQQKSNNIQQKTNNVPQRPNNGQQRPNNGQQRPSNGQQQPNNVQQQPNNVQHQPTKAQQQPTKVQQQPIKVQQQPTKVQQQPTKVQQRSNKVQQRANTVQQQSNNVQQQSNNVQKQSNNVQPLSNNTQQQKKNTLEQSINKSVEGGPPFNCITCKMVFNDSKSYQDHLLTHERPYSCQICNKKFAYKGTLRQHLHKHIGDKCHECKICHKKFSMKKMLLKHEETHKQGQDHADDVKK